MYELLTVSQRYRQFLVHAPGACAREVLFHPLIPAMGSISRDRRCCQKEVQPERNRPGFWIVTLHYEPIADYQI